MKKLLLTAVTFFIIGITYKAIGSNKDTINRTLVNSSQLVTQEEFKDKVDYLEKKLDVNAQAYKNETDEKINTLNNRFDNQRYTEWLISGGFGAGLMLIIGLVSLILWVPNYVKKKTAAAIADALHEQSDHIIKLLDNASFESRLKRDKQITIVSSTDEEAETIKKTFRRFDFKKIDFKTLSAYEAIDADLIIFNNINSTSPLSNELMKEINAKADVKTCFVYYGKYNPILDTFHSINMANTEYTLYARILETLKVKSLLIHE